MTTIENIQTTGRKVEIKKLVAKLGSTVVVGEGAREAWVVHKKSLLPAGVREERGSFERGDVVEVVTADGARVTKGLVSYDSEEPDRVKGMKSGRIRELHGGLDYEEVIHRDNLVMIP
jgi:glutamate 5-kinase